MFCFLFYVTYFNQEDCCHFVQASLTKWNLSAYYTNEFPGISYLEVYLFYLTKLITC